MNAFLQCPFTTTAIKFYSVPGSIGNMSAYALALSVTLMI